MASHKTYFLSSLAFAALSLAQDCTLTLPANPLSATGLATPFTLSGCDQTQFGDEGDIPRRRLKAYMTFG